MEIKTINLKSSDNNTYIVIDNNECIVIDPSCNDGRIQQAIKPYDLKAILLTHGHYDHFLGLYSLHQNYPNVPIYLNDYDLHLATGEVHIFNQQALLNIQYLQAEDFIDLKEGTIHFGMIEVTVINAQGHSNGCNLYKIENALFTGDVLFKESVGRCDLVDGSESKMIKTLKAFKQYDNSLLIYPGHGPSSTLLYEKQHNPYLIHLNG